MWLLNATPQHKKVVTNVFLLKLLCGYRMPTCQGKVLNIFKLSFRPTLPIGVNAKGWTQIKHFYWLNHWNQPPKGFTIGVKAENENIFKNLPLYGPQLSPRHKKDAYQLNLEGQFATLGPMFWYNNKILLFWWNS
jgi:hypothetical protein